MTQAHARFQRLSNFYTYRKNMTEIEHKSEVSLTHITLGEDIFFSLLI